MDSGPGSEVDARQRNGARYGAMIAAALLFGYWLAADIGFARFFMHGNRWVTTLGVVINASIAGALLDNVQPLWQKDGGWSPRVLGYAVGGSLMAIFAVVLFLRNFWLG